MAGLVYNQNTLRLTVQVKTDETFIPDEEIRKLQLEANQIEEEYKVIIEKVKTFLKRCDDWNRGQIEKPIEIKQEQKSEENKETEIKPEVNKRGRPKKVK